MPVDAHALVGDAVEPHLLPTERTEGAARGVATTGESGGENRNREGRLDGEEHAADQAFTDCPARMPIGIDAQMRCARSPTVLSGGRTRQIASPGPHHPAGSSRCVPAIKSARTT